FAETVQLIRAGSIDRYFLVTRGAEVVSDADHPAIGLAPLLGLARVAMSERSDLKLTLVDLDELVSIAELEHRLSKIGTEQEVALRGASSYAARVHPFALPEVTPAPKISPAPGSAFSLVLGEKGRLDSLGFRACERPRPGLGQVEVEVAFAPLAFRDV